MKLPAVMFGLDGNSGSTFLGVTTIKSLASLRILSLTLVFHSIFLANMAQSAERIIEGTVYYDGKEPASGAAVELEDKTTMQIISHLSDRQGHFRFMGLNPDKDYTIRAMKKGYWSKARNVSRFSSRAAESIDLYLRADSSRE